MTTLGNHHHDFPALAKQSGFFFQLHKGKVNWSEIGNLDINDITENRDFYLLERNLMNVINCNLEEYESKILDRNFVKLFKLAQLGVEYLSYCETYLDRCVIILQEQLLAFQEECKALKYEKEKRREEEIRIKRKGKTPSFQCEKCDKAFISDVYLKFHDKRRHNSPSTPKSPEGSIKACLDASQQTEREPKTSTSTQTALLSDRSTLTHGEETSEKAKTEHAVKIENLEREIQHLKERLRKAENALTDKMETPKSNGCHTPMCHNTMLLLLPPQQASSGSSYQEVSPKYLVPAPEILQPKCSLIQVPVDARTPERKPPPTEDSCLSDFKPGTALDKSETNSQKVVMNTVENKESGVQGEVKNDFEKKERNGEKGIVKVDGAVGVEHFRKCKKEANEDFECEKENLDPNTEKAKLSKPLPPPRKSKKLIVTRLDAENGKEDPPGPKREGGRLMGPVVVGSTPVKGSPPVSSVPDIRDEFPECLSDIQKRQSTSNDSLRSDLGEDRRRSFFKNMVKRNSPKFQFLRKSLRRSLTSLYGSVSSTGRDSTEGVDPARSAVVEGLNGRLRELGVNPEWTGIPKKTMKQKLKILKHRRKLLTKENPMYPVVRQNVEETIFQKLKKNLEGRKTKKASDEVPTQELVIGNEAEGGKPQKCVMYDIESSDSTSSDSEVSLEEQGEVEGNVGPENEPTEKEFDLSVFQVGRGSSSKATGRDVSVRVEDWPSDSDTDGGPSVGKNSTKCNSSDEMKEEKSEDGEDHRLGFFFQRQDKPESQSILKSEGLQSKLQLSSKKKVWFGNACDDILDGLSDSPTEDWSFKSDWEKDLA